MLHRSSCCCQSSSPKIQISHLCHPAVRVPRTLLKSPHTNFYSSLPLSINPTSKAHDQLGSSLTADSLRCRQPLPHPIIRAMSDDAYSSFLDQANQDTGTSKASTQSTSASTKAVDTDVPPTLQKVEQYYTSEADEPFEPVSLQWKGKNMPSESTYSTIGTT